jgi:hypothetical protein
MHRDPELHATIPTHDETMTPEGDRADDATAEERAGPGGDMAPPPSGSAHPGAELADGVDDFEEVHGRVMAENAQSEAELEQALADRDAALGELDRAVAEDEAHARVGHTFGRPWQASALVVLTTFSAIAAWFAALAIGLGTWATAVVALIITGAEVAWVAAIANMIKGEES